MDKIFGKSGKILTIPKNFDIGFDNFLILHNFLGI